MTIRAGWVSAALAVALCGAPIAASSLQTRAGVPRPPTKSKPTAQWPDAKTMEKQKKDAETRKMFSDTAPVAFTLVADFKAVNKDRNPTSTKLFPATIRVMKTDGTEASFDLQIRTRGHSRRNFQTCDFAPLRLEFAKDKAKGTVFAEQSALKLGTHCRNAPLFEQYVLREYVIYRMHNMITPRSFRARLAKVTYVDAATQKPLAMKYGMFIEDDDDVAKRMEGRITLQTVALPRIDRESFTSMAVFEYFIGNTDMSIVNQHNVRLVQTPAGPVYTVPYDFDYAGLVDASYAVPAKGLGLASVRDRLYRGPCHSPAEFKPHFDQIRQIRPSLAGLYDSVPDLDPRYKRDALKYLDAFFAVTDRDSRIDDAFGDSCLKKGLM